MSLAFLWGITNNLFRIEISGLHSDSVISTDTLAETGPDTFAPIPTPTNTIDSTDLVQIPPETVIPTPTNTADSTDLVQIPSETVIPTPIYTIDSTDLLQIRPETVTLVSAYYDIPSKRPAAEYQPWIQNFMTLQDNMVLFTSQDLVPHLSKLREHRPNNTRIIALSLNETRAANDYGGMDFWQHQHTLDPENDKHSKELYVVWIQKSRFIESVMELNPFNSTFFAWVDVGYLRDSLLVDQRMIRFLPATLTKEQTLILDTHAMDRASHVGGGFIGGYKEGLSRWIKQFYAIIEANYRDHFVGKDQPWMFETCQRTPGLCMLIEARSTFGDPWFYFAPLLHGIGLNTTT